MSGHLPAAEMFVSKGILPENLPPVFTTGRLWSEYSKMSSNYMILRDSIGDPAIYNASKRGGQRRIFSVPHPSFVRDAGIFIERHWPSLLAIIEKSKGSASKPSFTTIGHRHIRMTPHSDLPRLRLKALSRFKYCLITDVSRFFPSIYTHSIPWAINGKALAKTDNNPNSATIFGNKLDFISRQSQSKQTIGIAVGPDTSKIISEIIMASVDASFLNRSAKNTPTFVRHVDDYWIGGNSHEECEKHLQNLRLSLREFELDINDIKTKIVSTKFIFGQDWPFEFDKDIVENLSASPVDPNNVLPILGNIIERATSTSDDGIIKHAIRIMDEQRLWHKDWDMLEHFLAQCAVQFPHSIDYVARVVSWRKRIWKDVDEKLWREVCLLTITQSAPTGRDSEVIWALWLLKELGSKISKQITDIIISNNGAITLCFLAHFINYKLVSDRRLKNKLQDVVSGNVYSGPFWPLTLELVHLGIGHPSWGTLTAPSSMKILHDAKASIIEWNALPKVFSQDPEGGDEDPEYAIEDYGADYGDAEEEEENEADGNDEDTESADHFRRLSGIKF